MVVTASGGYEAVFTPTNTTDYNAASAVVNVTADPDSSSDAGSSSDTGPSSSNHSSHASAPRLPSRLTDAASHIQADFSGIIFPSGVTKVTLSAAQPARNNSGDKQAANVYHLVISSANLNVIGMPYVYTIQLLDQNGNPITGFSGKVKVKIPLPKDVYGTPRIFRYEESTGTLTDMNAAVEDGFLTFETDHFSYYAVAGTGDSIALDTKSYQMPINGKYQIGVKLTGSKASSVKVYSTSDKTAAVTKLKNGNVQVTGKSVGTAYIMFDVYDNRNKLLTHASVRLTVQKGAKLNGNSARQYGLF
jgi:hypothetical protein